MAHLGQRAWRKGHLNPRFALVLGQDLLVRSDEARYRACKAHDKSEQEVSFPQLHIAHSGWSHKDLSWIVRYSLAMRASRFYPLAARACAVSSVPQQRPWTGHRRCWTWHQDRGKHTLPGNLPATRWAQPLWMRYHRGNEVPPALHMAISAGICEKEMQILARGRALGQTEAGPWFHNDVEPWACFLPFVYFAGTGIPKIPVKSAADNGYLLCAYGTAG